LAETISILVAGFSVISAAVLFFAYALFMPFAGKNWLSQLTCGLFVLALANIQYTHFQYFMGGFEPLASANYRFWLFVVPSMFYLFSRSVIQPNAPAHPLLLLHLTPLALPFLLPQGIALPVLFLIGAGYSVWLANTIYGLRDKRRQFRFEMFFFVVMSVIAIFVLILGFSIPYIDNRIFYFFYSNSIGLAFMLVLAGIVAIPGLLSDLSEAARIKYVASTLSGIDVDAALRKLESLMVDDNIYRDENLNLSMLAAELDITGHQLSELINSRLGLSFSRYVREQRVEAAKKLLLADGRQSVLSISLDTGFKSQSSFYAAFKESTGISPGDFRKRRD
jgi:AraC-like DNA-binding protein